MATDKAKRKLNLGYSPELPEFEFSLDDVKEMCYAQAMLRVMNLKHELYRPSSPNWLNQVRELGFLLSTLTEEQWQSLVRLSYNPKNPNPIMDDLFG